MANNLIDEEKDGFWTGLLVGGLLGTVAGFFLGGDDNNEVKRKLKEKAFVLWDDLGNFTDSAKDKILDVRDEVVQEAEDVGEKAEEAANIARQKVEAITASAQQAVEEQVAQVKKTTSRRANLFSKKFFLQKGRSLQKKTKV